MPTYGYECKSCGNGFEAFQKMTDDSLTTCEECGGELKKKIFAPGIVFKGTGFYVNDYAKKSAGQEESAPVTTEAKAGETPAGEAKTAEAPTSQPTTETKPAEPASTPKPAAPAVSTPA
jgi:putative FmdB family regulatory protein